MTPVDIVIFAWVFLTGLLIGSFLNVCIARLPARGMSIVTPRSHCFSCGATIRWYDNIPLLSYALLRAGCRHCKSPISVRYPLIELATGLAFLFSAWWWLWDGAWAADFGIYVRAVAGAVVFCALVVASGIDLDRRIIPDEITIPGIFIGPALALAVPTAFLEPLPLTGADWLDAFAGSVAGVAAGGGVVFAAGFAFKVLLRKEAMGFGDVKLLAACGGFLGWQGALIAFLGASLVGAVAGIIYLALTRSRYIPFGPSLSFAAMAYYWFPDHIRHFLFVTYPGFLERVMGLQ